MARKTYVYDEKLGKLVEKGTETPKERGPIVFGDLPDIVSPIDRRVIHGRAGMREHNRRHGVTFTEDYKQEWKDKAKARAEFMQSGKPGDRQRARAVAEAYERVSHGYKPRKLGESDG